MGGRQGDLERRLRRYEVERAKLGERMSQVGFIKQGTVRRRLLSCGQAKCKCQTDASARHGPYTYWTTKVRGKTVSRLLDQGTADLYELWIANRRQLEKVLLELKALSEKTERAILKQRRTQNS